jgi:hypothetical protein
MSRIAHLSALTLTLTTTAFSSLPAQLPYCTQVTEVAGERKTWSSGNRDAGVAAYYEARAWRASSDCLTPTPYGNFFTPRHMRARAGAGAVVSLLGNEIDILKVMAQAYAQNNSSYVEAELSILNFFFSPTPHEWHWRHNGFLDLRNVTPVLLVGIAGGFQFGPVTVGVAASATAIFTSGMRLGIDVDGVFINGEKTVKVEGNASASLSILGIVGVALNSYLKLLDSRLAGEITLAWTGNLVGWASATFQAVAFRLDLCGWFTGFSGCINLVNESTPRRTYAIYP